MQQAEAVAYLMREGKIVAAVGVRSGIAYQHHVTVLVHRGGRQVSVASDPATWPVNIIDQPDIIIIVPVPHRQSFQVGIRYACAAFKLYAPVGINRVVVSDLYTVDPVSGLRVASGCPFGDLEPDGEPDTAVLLIDI